ncbi:malonate decarboxylase acyl carrier protein [Streptomyces sp. NBC_00121]|uniref:malonate decarboxylase acyl carrier protein n=1 Tax=unclassified Streptomyces TaxID=2593676 RepID=UPI0028C42360|nr:MULTISPECIES: malonate decarboxylase acyl carrier protein [unclassified Streptomyces]WNO62452.1 malonate decarboxylase acyl carrier protein [Streptomyces sp. AM2-3-1]WSC67046.1 malonate decarboxylase acyl carrier protein [Streptomyces sp. NBC_01760]WTE57418.1 malonate decarboxylase acyl carrier protein [Streptomyces sp. NBC_01617]WTI84928.1 malonate decarboxylase acyl carrier protein [Streptomyces sp. NBC_00724]
MRTLTYQFPASTRPAHRAHVGVVGSGDLEILLEPADGSGNSARCAQVRVRTSVEGFDEVWQTTLERFFARTPVLGTWELNDSAATPALVTLRLQQAAEAAGAPAPDAATEGES